MQLRRWLEEGWWVWCDLYEVMAGKGSEVVFTTLARASPASSWHYRSLMRINVIPAPRCPAACTFLRASAADSFSRRSVCLGSGAYAVDQMTASKSNHYDVPQEKNTGFHSLFLTKTSPSLDCPLEKTSNERKGEWMGVNSYPYGYSDPEALF